MSPEEEDGSDRGLFVTAASDGVEGAVTDLGGTGPPALLVHANGFHGLAYRALARELTGSLRCFAVDLRGHGAAGVPANLDFSWSGHGTDVLAAASLLEREVGPGVPPVGIGHSLGGAALLLAEAARPGTFAALYCYEPVLVPASERTPPGTENMLARGARGRRDEFTSTEAALAHYADRQLFARVLPEVLEDYVRHGFEPTATGTVRLRCRPEHEARTFEGAWASDVVDRLPAVRCPVVVAVGGRSHDVARRWALSALDELPDGRTTELPGLGHLGPFEDPAAVAASVRGMLTSLGR